MEKSVKLRLKRIVKSRLLLEPVARVLESMMR